MSGFPPAYTAPNSYTTLSTNPQCVHLTPNSPQIPTFQTKLNLMLTEDDEENTRQAKKTQTRGELSVIAEERVPKTTGGGPEHHSRLDS